MPSLSTHLPHGGLVAFLYRQILRREATAAEVSEWSAALEGGLSIDALLSQISTSPEESAVAERELDRSVAAVGNMSAILLGRRPTPADVACWTEQLRRGRPLASFIDDVLDDPGVRRHGPADQAAEEEAIAFAYRHALGREATADEVALWSRHMQEGMSVPTFLRAVRTSEEARRRDALAAQSCADAIAFVYRHALGREPDDTATAGWSAQLRDGLPFPRFLSLVLQSDEARALADSRPDEATDGIAFVYRHALGREPDEADLREWSGHLSGGLSFPRFLSLIRASDEARAHAAGRTDEGVADGIAFVYRHALGREATAADLEVWAGHLASGLTFQRFLLSMMAGEEARAHVKAEAAVERRPAGMTDGAFVAHLFEICLGRCALPAQIEDWTRRFAEQGYRRSDVAMSFIEAAIRDAEDQNGRSAVAQDFPIMGTDRVLNAGTWAARAAEIAAGRNPVAPGPLSAPYVVRPHAVRVSAIASLYKGGRYIRKFLDNMTGQSLRENFELVIVDADSPDGEREVIETYRKSFPNIRYERINYRIGIYDAWNVGVSLARGDYLTNTNLDDLRRSDSLELQARTLDAVPFADVVYQDFFYSLDPELSFEEVEAFGFRSSLPIVTPGNLLAYNSPHNAPMWRRRLHGEVGLFDTTLKSAGDHEFWLRCLQAGKVFFKINTPHVVYYQNPEGVSTRPDSLGLVEGQRILRTYGRRLLPPEVYRDRASLSGELSALSGADVGLREAGGRYEDVQQAVLSFADRHAFAQPEEAP